jgi:hypothetical protein
LVGALLGAALLAMPPALLEAVPSLLSMAPAVLAMAPALLSGCADSGHHTAPAKAAATPALSRLDVLWLQRVSFGIDSTSVEELHRLGRARYLDHQLQGRETLPAPVAAELADLEITHLDPVRTIAEVNAERKAANAMPDGPDREAARKAFNERGNRLAYEAVRGELLRATYSPDQLQEEMVWFWLNHFSVHQAKADLRWLVADYTDRAIRR